MIRKLRRKFILINMMLVGIVLIIVFSILVATTYQLNVQQSVEAMHQAVSNAGLMQFPVLERSDRKSPSDSSDSGDSTDLDTNHATGASTDSEASDATASEPAPTGSSDSGEELPEGNSSENGPSDSPSDRFTTMIPVFSVILDDDNQVTQEIGGNVDITEDLVAEAVTEAIATNETHGLLSDLNLRFLISENHGRTVIAFADQTWELEAMQKLILNSLLVIGISLIAFFIISLFLSGITVRPVDEAWRRQQQFLADASHELKTPLTVILADINILLSHPSDTIGNQVKWVEYIQSEAERMKQLVQDMLFLAKGDTAQMDEHQKHVSLSLSDLVWSGLLPFESIAFENGVALNANIEPDLEFNGNESQLQRLVMILLDNACKYAGKPGSVTITLKHAQDKLCLSVHNTGEPIPPDRLEHVFERFFRADTARTRETGGYGLGLAIAQSIVESHRGRISVTSTAQDGTTFTILFPDK